MEHLEKISDFLKVQRRTGSDPTPLEPLIQAENTSENKPLVSIRFITKPTADQCFVGLSLERKITLQLF
jgi:hypothetical protein